MKSLIALLVMSLITGCSHTPKDPKNFEEAEAKYKNSESDSFYDLGDVVRFSLEEGKWDKAEHYAKIWLKKAEAFKDNWNYGNAIYYSNMAFSHKAFKKNDLNNAKKYLILASKTPGSPQLDSFGPFNLKSTRNLLDQFAKKDKKATIEFAQNCKKFVSSEPTKKLSDDELKLHERVKIGNLTEIDQFIEQVQKGITPDFAPVAM